MKAQQPPAPPKAQTDLAQLLRAQTAGLVTLPAAYAQWTAIAARFVERGASHVAALAEQPDRRFPDSYERVAALVLEDYVRSVRETAALPQSGALRFARELQKQRRPGD